LPRLTAYRSRHSYLSGILLDRDCADEALVALLRHIRKQRPFWHGVEFEALWGDGPTYSLLTATCDRLRIGRQEWNHSTRAVLFSQRDRAQIEAAIAAKERHLRRKLRRLQNQGQVACTLVGPCGSWAAASETFLSLEHQGWKANAGSSLRSTTGGESFFREVAAGFGREGRMVFAELRLDGKAIASSSNFASGRSGFAFKIGWQPELAKVSPGLQVELHLLREVISHQSLLPIEFWDSGAQPGSYMEGLWPSRRTVVSLAIGTTWVGQHVLRLVQTARHVRRRWRGRGGPVSQMTAPSTEPAASRPTDDPADSTNAHSDRGPSS
jgi:hypothetical protein